MNRVLLPLILMFCGTVFSQKEDYKDVIAKETCECMNSKKLDNLKKNEFELNLGVCIIKSYNNNIKLVPKNEQVNITGDDPKSEAFFENIGLKMAVNCPDILLKASETSEDNNSSTNDESGKFVLTGKYTSIKDSNYFAINVKEDSGKMNEMVLLYSFENAFLIQDKVLKVGDKIEVTYEEADLYNPILKKFIASKIIMDIKKL